MISVLLFITTLWAAPEPSSVYGLEKGLDFRYMQRRGVYTPMAEVKWRDEVDGGEYRQLLLGTYKTFKPKWRWGLFLQGEEGLRWADGWKNVGGHWDWHDEKGRWEISAVTDLTYRTETQIERLVFEWKNRAYWYFGRDALQWRTRPGVNYFFMENDRPSWQLNAATELYFPLNYDIGKMAETWYYLGALKHFGQNWKVGPLLAWRQRYFMAQDGFERRFHQSWESKQETLFVGLSVVWVEAD